MPGRSLVDKCHRIGCGNKGTIGIRGMYRINEVSFPKLVTALRTGTTTAQYTDYDKSKTSYSDVLDAFLQLSLTLQSK
jgi:hypothetical protein